MAPSTSANRDTKYQHQKGITCFTGFDMVSVAQLVILQFSK